MHHDSNQQSLIIHEMTVSKRKLEEENQSLRDELSEAKMVIRILKMKVQGHTEREERPCAVSSNASTVKQGNRADLLKALDKVAARKSLKNKQSKKAIPRREAFRNPMAKGSKMFQPRNGTDAIKVDVLTNEIHKAGGVFSPFWRVRSSSKQRLANPRLSMSPEPTNKPPAKPHLKSRASRRFPQ